MDSFLSKVGEKLEETFWENITAKSNLETLKNNFKSLSDKACDVEEKIKNVEMSGKKKRKREVEEWLKRVTIIENEIHQTLESGEQTQGFLIKLFNGDPATQLNAKVLELIEQSRHFGELLVDVCGRGDVLLTNKLSGRGFKQNLKRIWNLLKSDEVTSIGIYGMGGMGKTALARHINNMIVEKRKEKRVCWITVSQMFSIKKLQDEIARFIGLKGLSDEDDEDKRAARLNQAIKNNFILILDDVWENICLEKLGDPLRLQGCRLILTTRSFEVCCRMGCQEKVEVKKLHADEAWNLFKQKLGQDIALHPDVEKIAKRMAKVCGGLPLGIIVLAGSMRGETSIHVWRNEFEKLTNPKLMQDDKENEVFKVLKYSFDRLDLNHQRCFLHCSLYPEDDIIYRKELVDGFISEGLVDKRKSRKSQHDQGYSILNNLVKVCLLESDYELHWVKMHDLVRAMALKITKGKNMVISGLGESLKEIPSEGEWTKDLEKVSLMCNRITKIPDGMSPDCPNLTTIILRRNFSLTVISDSFFSQLGNLCFLDLSYTIITKLPNSLSNLENLKALKLECCETLVDIPYLGKLKKLEELNLTCTEIVEVPQGMEELVNLRFLSLYAVYLDMFQQGLFLNYRSLQCLHLPCHIKAPLEEIVRLKHLEEFWGRAESVSDFSKFIRQTQLTTFRLWVGDNELEDNKLEDDQLKDYLFGSDDPSTAAVLDSCGLKNEEEEDLSTLFRSVQKLILSSCEGLCNSLFNDFSRWNSSVKVLEIKDCDGVECFLTNEQFSTASQELEPFRTLETVRVASLQNFIGFIPSIESAIEPPLPQPAVFSSLRFLHIFQCNKMRKLGLPLSEFQNLEEIFIGCCSEVEEIIEVPEAEGQVISLPKLKELHLFNLPRLKSICNTTMSCGSVEQIRLARCQELKKLPLYFDPTSHSPPQTLEEIWIAQEDKEWWESLEWEHPIHSLLLQPLLRFALR